MTVDNIVLEPESKANTFEAAAEVVVRRAAVGDLFLQEVQHLTKAAVGAGFLS